MRRRAFIGLLGGGALFLPRLVSAQSAPLPVIGFLNARSPEAHAPFVAAFRQGLSEAGYVEGKNVAIEYRWAENQLHRLTDLAAALVARGVALIVTSGSDAAALAAKAATATIPIVATFGGDPVEQGIVASLNRPGGNITGFHLFSTVLLAKRLELLRQLLPDLASVAFLVNPTTPYAAADQRAFEAAAKTLGLRAAVVAATTLEESDAALANLRRQGVGALLVESDGLFLSLRERLVALAKQYSLPAIYSVREYAAAGGLMSYSGSVNEGYRQVGVYAGLILKGESPADLPVLQWTTFELVINLKTAAALGLALPPTLIAQADEVIE